MPNEEQEARIALLQYFASQMQGTRTHILSAIVLVLAIFEIWFRIPERSHTSLMSPIMSMAVGLVIAFIAFFTVRIFWYGELVWSAIHAPIVIPTKGKPLISQLDYRIMNHARCDSERKERKKLDFILRKLVQLGDNRNAYLLMVLCSPVFVGVTVILLLLAPTLGLGPEVQIIAAQPCSAAHFPMDLSQIPLVVATILTAVATFLVYLATEKMAHNVIRPFLVVRASTREQREVYFQSSNFPGVSNDELRDFIEKRGIIVENVGLGPAVNGRVIVTIDGARKVETFVRLSRSEGDRPFHYFYPSPTSRDIVISEDVHEISVETKYSDIADKHYCQRPQRIEI